MSLDHPEPSRESARPPGTIRVGQIGGTDVLVTSSWFIVAALISFIVAPAVDQVQPGLGAWKYVAGAAFAVLLYLSVLLHEAAHAGVAKHYSHKVESITLHFLGGATSIQGESRRPREEFWIAVVGPLASLAVGLGALALSQVAQFAQDGLLGLAVQGLALANLVVGILNLIPGLPLDGGRVLKAGVWAVSGNVHHGTIAAGWGGRLAGVAALGWPLFLESVLGRSPTILDYVLAFVIAIFLWTGATASIHSAKVRSRLPSLVARDLARRTLTVPENLPVSEAVRRAQEAAAGSIVTVTAAGEPVGIVSEHALAATPQDRRPWIPASSLARTIESGLSLPVTIAGEQLIRAMTQVPAHEYLLIEGDGTLYGVLSTADVDRAFSRR